MPFPDWADEQLSTDLPVLRARGENQELEYMESFPQQVRDLAKEIAAFASSNQGMILIGVSDVGDLVGLGEALTVEGRDSYIRRIEGICRGTVKPAITPVAKYAVEGGRPVLVVIAPKGSQPIYYSNNIPYVRHITEARPAEPHEVIELIRQWLPSTEVTGEEPDPYSQLISRLASIVNDVTIYGEEAGDRMVNPWLAQWRAQFEQAASELREIAVEDTAIKHGVDQDLTELAQTLDSIAHFRMYMGCEPEIERLLNAALSKAGEVKSKWIDPVPLSSASIQGIKTNVLQATRKLRGLCERAEEVIGQGRVSDFQAEASNTGILLLRDSQFNLDSLAQGLSARLRDVGRTLHLVETMPLYPDGGKSVQAILDRVQHGCSELEQIASSLGK
jgi:hypothetical protein